MSTLLDNLDFEREWYDIHTDTYEGYSPNMTDFHMHKYFEISIIISGNVNVLLSNSVEKSSNAKVVLLRPLTPHYIYCEPDILYRRRNILFSENFVRNYVPEWQQLVRVFGHSGAILKISDEQCREYVEIADKIDKEPSLFRKRLLLLSLLSFLCESIKEDVEFAEIPPYISEALKYIGENYGERIVASELVEKLGIGRTTFLTSFKKYTGSTFNEYLNRTRLKYAISYLQQGLTEQEVSEKCGFGDACNLIRCCKRCLGLTPKKYIASLYNDCS